MATLCQERSRARYARRTLVAATYPQLYPQNPTHGARGTVRTDVKPPAGRAIRLPLANGAPPGASTTPTLEGVGEPVNGSIHNLWIGLWDEWGPTGVLLWTGCWVAVHERVADGLKGVLTCGFGQRRCGYARSRTSAAASFSWPAPSPCCPACAAGGFSSCAGCGRVSPAGANRRYGARVTRSANPRAQPTATSTAATASASSAALRAGTTVEVRRSARRRRTVSAYRDGDRTIVLLPARLSRAEEEEWIDVMLERLVKQEQRSLGRAARSDADLARRATELSRRYLRGVPQPVSVRWVSNQGSRWGSCTPVDGAIRLSDRLVGMPPWVIDYVLVHELAHLIEIGHGPAFTRLVDGFPKAERARGYLLGVVAGAGWASSDESSGGPSGLW